MSSFGTLEASREDSRPLEIYAITLGPLSYRFTSDPSDVTVAGLNYTATPIKRGAIVVGQAERRRVLSVKVPYDNPFARLFMGPPPGAKARLTITRLQRDEVPTFNTLRKVFDGAVLSVTFPDAVTAELQAQTREAAVAKHLPRYSQMGQCNHTIYGTGCEVVADAFKFSSTVSAVSGRTITVAGAGASGFNFTGGFVRLNAATQDFRMVLSQSGNILTLLLPFRDSPLGASIDCFAGCNHNVTGDCATVFDNVVRFGGFPFVPSRNIFAKGVS